MRKPIYYMVEESSCSFVIIDNDVALFYIIKENENVINKYGISFNVSNNTSNNNSFI